MPPQGAVDLSQPLRRDAALARGLVSLWRVVRDARGGVTWRDLAGRNHGTLTGTMTPSTAATGWHGTARAAAEGEMRFPGAYAPYVDVPAHATIEDLGAGSFTLAWWMRPLSFGQFALGYLCEKTWHVQMDSTRINVTDLYATSSAVFVSSTYTIVPTWEHFAAVYRRDLAPILYHNGLAMSGTSYAPSGARTTDAGVALRIGNNQGGTRSFEGALDEIGLYSRSLSALEASQYYHSSLLGHPALLRRARLLSGRVAGGTNYPQTLGGTLASTGALTRATTQALAGVV